jgi:2'-5' RNA ligase
MRTFVAIELPEACKKKLGDVIARLRPRASGVRWVDASSAHLTLKFIGELSEADAPKAIEALRKAAASAKTFSFRIEGISGFPPHGKPRVVHSPVVEPTGALASLAEAVDVALQDALGTAVEERSFKPHVTLGRLKDPRRCPTVDELAATVQDANFGEVRADAIVLMKSELTPGGARYMPIERVPLGV